MRWKSVFTYSLTKVEKTTFIRVKNTIISFPIHIFTVLTDASVRFLLVFDRLLTIIIHRNTAWDKGELLVRGASQEVHEDQVLFRVRSFFNSLKIAGVLQILSNWIVQSEPINCFYQ